MREQAVRLSADGLNFQRITRLLRMDHQSVIHWVNTAAAPLPPAALPEEVNNAELDEWFTFAGEKKAGLRDDAGGSTPSVAPSCSIALKVIQPANI